MYTVFLYNLMMSESAKTPKRRGPKTNFSYWLGVAIWKPLRLPMAIFELLKEGLVQRLLNWMANDSVFKDKILAQVPEHDPPEPKNTPASEENQKD
jgi:hypothetical protein